MKKIFSFLILLFTLSFNYSIGASSYKALKKYNSFKIYNNDGYIHFEIKDFYDDEKCFLR